MAESTKQEAAEVTAETATPEQVANVETLRAQARRDAAKQLAKNGRGGDATSSGRETIVMHLPSTGAEANVFPQSLQAWVDRGYVEGPAPARKK